METVSIKTPLNVNVEMAHAGVGRRLLAFLLDLLFIFIYLWLINKIFFQWLGLDQGVFSSTDIPEYDLDVFLQVIYLIFLLPAIFYSFLTEYLFNGQTFGKMICGIRVVKLSGYRAGFSEYFTRWVFRLIDFWTGSFMVLFFIPIFGENIALSMAGLMTMGTGFVAFFLILRTKNSQRLGDIVAGTTVLKIKEKQSIDITILEELQEAYIPRYQQVMKLSDNDARIIKDTFMLAKKGRDYKTMKRLRERLEKVMDIQSDQSDIEFIDTVMKDFNYYTQKL
ncbi:MAG: RDD family protein [Weeksellaceae bacterium]